MVNYNNRFRCLGKRYINLQHDGTSYLLVLGKNKCIGDKDFKEITLVTSSSDF